jgi:thiamine-phosphate pyrophosphorylase
MQIDLRLYAILDPQVCGEHDLLELARRVVAGGATLVQLRDKEGDTRAMIGRARAVKAVLGKVPLIVNDRVDVAMASGADGVHVGQEDVDVEDARRIVGPDAIIGLSIKTVEQAQAAPLDRLHYAGIGGVYGTTSKAQKSKPIGPSGLARVVEALHRRRAAFPTCGIAGINANNAAEVIAAGADGIAVISALSLVSDPEAAARELRRLVDGALAERER